jgi:hypothetical protein
VVALPLGPQEAQALLGYRQGDPPVECVCFSAGIGDECLPERPQALLRRTGRRASVMASRREGQIPGRRACSEGLNREDSGADSLGYSGPPNSALALDAKETREGRPRP